MKTLLATLAAQRGKLRTVLRGGMLAVVIALGAALPASQAQAAGGFTFSPASGSYQVGDTVTVEIRENSGSQPTNAVSASFTYPANLLQYVSGDATGSKFTISAAEKGGNGSVQYDRGAFDPVTGDQLIEKAIFRVIAAGTATLSFKDSSVAVSSDDNDTNVATARGSASFTLKAAPTPNPNPNPTPSPSTPPPVKPRPVTNITPQGTTTPVPLVDDDVVEVEVPFDVQPATIQPDGVSKIEYYLNNKLLKTVNVAPYKYHVDTTKLLNGRYKLTTKTYYTNGQIDTVNQTLVVKNPFGWTQLRLRLQHYWWLIVLLVVLLIAAVAVLMARKRSSGGGTGGYTPTGDSGYGGTVVTPQSGTYR